MAKLGKVLLLSYLIFIFFGTSLPFQEKVRDPADISTSNQANQVILSLLFSLSSICVWSKRDEVASLIKKEKYLTLFLLWCLISILWSQYSFVSFKRLIQLVTTVTVSLAALLYCKPSDKLLRFFRLTACIYIVLSFISILIVPGATMGDGLAWRGLASHKNQLGQVALISIIIWAKKGQLPKLSGKVSTVVVLLISVILLLGSRSVTAILTGVLLGFSGILLGAGRRFRHLGLGNGFPILTVLFIVIAVFLDFYFDSSLYRTVLDLLGKDTSFTGRTDLWTAVFEGTRRQLVIGSGYGGYWVMGSPQVAALYGDFPWLPRQAHLGYLDILNETGIVGLLLVIAMVVNYFRNLTGFGKPHLWKWFVISALVLNLQESTLFRPNSLTGTTFIFGYLALYLDQSVAGKK